MKLLLSVLLLAFASTCALSCANDGRLSLAALAQKAPKAEVTAEEKPAEKPPLVVLAATRPEKLLGRMRMLLPLLVPEGLPAWVDPALAAAPPVALYGELTGVSVGLDPDSAMPLVEKLEGLLLVSPAAGGGGKLEADRWQALLAAAWPLEAGAGGQGSGVGGTEAGAGGQGSGVGGTEAGGPGAGGADGPTNPTPALASCELRTAGILCVAGRSTLPDAAIVDAFLARAASAAAVPGFRLVISVPGILETLERTVGVPLLWAVMPEQVRTLDTLSLMLTDSDDRVRLALTGQRSALLNDLAGVFGGAVRPVRLPADLPGVAFTTVDSVDDRAEKLQEHWLDKARLFPELKLTKLLDETWNSQMLGLSSGIVGVALAGEVNPESPFDGAVWLLQPTDRKMLDKRFAHIFATKYFKLTELTLRTGEVVMRAVRKNGGKLGKERLAWFYRDGTCYVAANSEILRKLAERMFVPDWQKDKPMLDLELSGEERARVSLSLKRLLDNVVLSEELGFAGGMALGVLKTAVATLEKDVVVRLVVTTAPDGPARVEVTVENLLVALDVVLEKLQPLLRLVPKSS